MVQANPSAAAQGGANQRRGVRPIPIGEDHLQFKHDPQIQNQLDQNEHIVFSCQVLKYNRFGMKQTRNLLLTTHQISNVKDRAFQRSIRLQKVMALSKSTEAGNKEFVVHVRGEYDYRFICELRDDMFEQIKACYFHLMNENLPVFGVPGKLKSHCTSKNDAKAGADKIPPDSFRLRAEDLYEPLLDTPAATTNNTTPDEDDELPTAGNHRPSFVNPKNDANVTLSDFVIKSVIGRGSFGKVFLVQKRGSNNVYAMKSLRKDVIIEYDQVESTRLEKDILLQADHPFLVGMSYVFQTDQKIFFVMRFVRGGELFMHLRQVTRFPEDRARFYAIQVAMALGHLHSKNIIYRDLKPENILMDEDGYICLTDFGLAKVLEGNAQAFSFCGTPDYLAPEILVERGHSFPVDWWALGILTYEMIVGFPPFYTGTQNNSKMYELIKKKAVYFPDPQRHNIMMSENCKNFITRLLEKNPANRLGSRGGLEEVLTHPWFAELDHEKILERRIEAPVRPTLSQDVFDVSNFDSTFTTEDAMVSVVPAGKMPTIQNNQGQFENF